MYLIYIIDKIYHLLNGNNRSSEKQIREVPERVGKLMAIGFQFYLTA